MARNKTHAIPLEEWVHHPEHAVINSETDQMESNSLKNDEMGERTIDETHFV